MTGRDEAQRVDLGTPGSEPGRGHRVLATADSEAFTSVRRRATTREERYAMGKALRRDVPRRSLGDWHPSPDRADPVALLEESHRGRVSELVPVRVARMVASPYGFLRGSAVVMAADVAALPATGIMPVACGDSHLGNFGFYASPEGELVIDLNDFDEAHPGCWEWDLRRLVASIWVAGRENGRTEEQCHDAVLACVGAYRDEVRLLADMPLLARSYNRLDVGRLHETATEKSLRDEIERSVRRARQRTSDRALPRFTTVDKGERGDKGEKSDLDRPGQRRIVQEPPLITRLSAAEREAVAVALDAYLLTLAPHWRRAVGGYTLVDVAHKVVGVGSVGLRAYVALLEGSAPDDVLFLQLKQARRSVLAPFVHGGSAWHAHQGQRVVEYQQALQTVSDPLLGWTTVDLPGEGPLDFYVRQFRNSKGTIPLDAIDAAALTDYAGIVGHLLAKGHARTSGASMIAGYAGKGDKLGESFGRFARAYADQTEADHALLVAAVRSGRTPASEGALDKVGSAFRP
jgi:uncharacterized protein (DUF2252 family)